MLAKSLQLFCIISSQLCLMVGIYMYIKLSDTMTMQNFLVISKNINVFGNNIYYLIFLTGKFCRYLSVMISGSGEI